MASEPSSPAGRIRFGDFEVDLRSHELLRSGRRLRLQEKSFLVLQELLRSPGQVVTREELAAALWPKEYFVDVEHGLNTAVRRLREALGDSADDPRFIETLPRLGYRFIGAVEVGSEPESPPEEEEPPGPSTASAPPEDPTAAAPIVPSPIAASGPSVRAHRPVGRLSAALLFVAAVALLAILVARGRSAPTPAGATASAPAPGEADAVSELLARANYLRNVKRYAESRKFFEAALELDPGNARALGGLSLILMSERKVDQARETARRALELDPRVSDAHATLAVLARGAGQLAVAERHHRQAVEVDPANGKARNRLARLLLESGRIDEAREQILEARRLDPDNPDVQNIWMEYWLRTGDYERAIRQGESWIAIWAKAIEGTTTPWVRDMLGLAYLGARRPEDALAQFRALDPADDLRVALTLGYTGRTAEARAILDVHEREALALPADPGRSGAMAMAYVALGDFDRAFAHLDRQVAGRYFPGWLNCALFHSLRRDPRYPAFAARLDREFFGRGESGSPPTAFAVLPPWPRPGKPLPTSGAAG